MRRLVLLLLLASTGCSSSGSLQSTLTVESAALIAYIAPGASSAEVQAFSEGIGAPGTGVEQTRLALSAGILLVGFSRDATIEQRRGLFAKVADSKYFSSVQCSSCSAHPQRSSAPPG